MNSCDLEEVKHQLCQEALALIETDAEWKPFRPTLFSDSGHLCGKFFVSYGFYGRYELRVFVGRDEDGVCVFESVGISFNPAYSGEFKKEFREEGETDEQFDARFQKALEEFEASPAYIVYRHVESQERARQDQKKCEALTKMLGKDAPRAGQMVEVDEFPDNGIPNRSWWRFW